MIERLLAFSIQQRALVVVLTLVFSLLGIVAFSKVPLDAVPDVTNVQVQIITAAPSLGPLDVEVLVTTPVERSLAGIPGTEEIRSISRAGISVVTIAFEEHIDLERARQFVNERLAEARANIPPEIASPTLGPMSSGLGEVLHFEVKGEGLPLMERRQALDALIAPRLRLVPGVVDVNIFGGEAKTLEVTLDPERLLAHRIGASEVVEALRMNLALAGGAYLVDGRENVSIRGTARVQTPEELGALAVVSTPGKAPIYVRDVGQIHFMPRVRYGAVTRDGRADEGVVGVVMMLRGANSGVVVAAAKEALADVAKSLPEGMCLAIYYDRTELVHKTIRTVATNLLEASALVLLVLFLTLANMRAGVVVALSIPLALLGVFVGMWAGGVSGNLISLGAIDFGLVVDGSIIIVENAIRRLAERVKEVGRPLDDEERKQTVLEAAKEVRGATAFGEAIIALVYVPILALGSVEGRTFRPMALTVLFALGVSFVLSLTLVPALASWMLAKDTVDKESWLIHRAQRIYEPLLARAMKAPRLLGGAALVTFAASVGVFFTMGREFLPKLDEGTFVLAAVRLPSVSLEQSLTMSRQVERTLKRFPEVTSVISRTGRAEVAIDPMGINMTDVYVLLRPKSEWKTAHDTDGLAEVFQKALSEEAPGTGIAFSQPIEMNTNDLLAGFRSDLAVQIYGHDLVELKQTGDRMVRVLRALPGAKDVRMEQIAGTTELSIVPDRVRLGRYGISAKPALDTVAALAGIEVGQVVDGPVHFPIQVRWNERARRDAGTIAGLPVRTNGDGVVPLGQIATIDERPAPAQVSRERLARRVSVEANVRGRDIASFVLEAKRVVERDIKLPTGFSLHWAGEYERLEHAGKQLALVIPIVLLLIFVLLLATFGRAGPALLIFLNVPISISGGVFAISLRGLPFSISAGVGFIALFGVAVLNGLVLVSAIERARASASVTDAVALAARQRLRPVLTTALVASLGFLPMALAHGAGAEVQQPLATVVIGGIVTSTLLTLLVLPTLYAWLLGDWEPSTRSGPENTQ